MQQRLLARKPVNDDVQKRPDRQAEDEREGYVDGIHCGRKLDEPADAAEKRRGGPEVRPRYVTEAVPCYQVPPVLQPPSPPVVQARV